MQIVISIVRCLIRLAVGRSSAHISLLTHRVLAKLLHTFTRRRHMLGIDHSDLRLAKMHYTNDFLQFRCIGQI